MAAEMAVEITVQETDLTEDSQAKVEHLVETVQEDHSAKEDHSVRVQKEEALVVIVREDRSERTLTVQEDHSVKIQREEALVEENSNEAV